MNTAQLAGLDASAVRRLLLDAADTAAAITLPRFRSGLAVDNKKAEGSCGGDKDAEGSCGGDKEDKDAEGSCGGDKDAEGSCGGDKEDKDAEGKCGEGKCGGSV